MSLWKRPISAAFEPEQALDVAILTEFHHDVDLGARYERVVVFHSVRAVGELAVDVDFV